MTNTLIAYARKIQGYLDAGYDLREISNKSFESRKADMNIPYLRQIDVEGKTVTRIEAAPTVAQKAIYRFFSEKAPGSALPRYKFEVTLAGVVFTERLGRGIGNTRDLLEGQPTCPRSCD